MGDGDKKPKVDNPDRERLVALKRELQKERDGLVGALKRAAEDIGKGGANSKKSWVGTTANKWHSDVTGHRKTARIRIDKVLTDMQREIDRMPEKVTPEEATSMNRNRRL